MPEVRGTVAVSSDETSLSYPASCARMATSAEASTNIYSSYRLS